MKPLEWNEEKNEKLKKTRNVTFNQIIFAIENDKVLATEKSESKKHPQQSFYIIEINSYAYIVPFVDDKERNIRFLKTIFPSRKMTKKYLKKLPVK